MLPSSHKPSQILPMPFSIQTPIEKALWNYFFWGDVFYLALLKKKFQPLLIHSPNKVQRNCNFLPPECIWLRLDLFSLRQVNRSPVLSYQLGLQFCLQHWKSCRRGLHSVIIPHLVDNNNVFLQITLLLEGFLTQVTCESVWWGMKVGHGIVLFW